MLLSDEEIEKISHGKVGSTRFQYTRAAEAAILAKLASAELPEPEYYVRNHGVFNQVEKYYYDAVHTDERKRTRYTADQLRQAYAQGAAAQLAEKPTCWVTSDGEGFRMRMSPPVNAVPLGWQELYTRKEAK